MTVLKTVVRKHQGFESLTLRQLDSAIGPALEGAYVKVEAKQGARRHTGALLATLLAALDLPVALEGLVGSLAH